ncbi:hypothetical protein [Neisseria meningitidis]|uniref:hypothetical protein n=1 Tax=Neisseria meningitidis TaxID=487 RepID=UPI00067A8736|nr:hypothetical protein [Neisseria meningitidis]
MESKETFLPDKFLHRQVWIPACAGMTVDSRLRGNDDFRNHLKREKELLDSRLRGNDGSGISDDLGIPDKVDFQGVV